MEHIEQAGIHSGDLACVRFYADSTHTVPFKVISLAKAHGVLYDPERTALGASSWSATACPARAPPPRSPCTAA